MISRVQRRSPCSVLSIREPSHDEPVVQRWYQIMSLLTPKAKMIRYNRSVIRDRIRERNGVWFNFPTIKKYRKQTQRPRQYLTEIRTHVSARSSLSGSKSYVIRNSPLWIIFLNKPFSRVKQHSNLMNMNHIYPINQFINKLRWYLSFLLIREQFKNSSTLEDFL